MSAVVPNAVAWWAGVLTEVTPSPSPTPGLRDGLEESAISPGLAGFLAVFAIALASVVLFYSLTRKLRGVKYRAEAAESAEPGASAPEPGASVRETGGSVRETGG